MAMAPQVVAKQMAARQGGAAVRQGVKGRGLPSTCDRGTSAAGWRNGESVTLMRSLGKASCGRCYLDLGRGAAMEKKGRAPWTGHRETHRARGGEVSEDISIRWFRGTFWVLTLP